MSRTSSITFRKSGLNYSFHIQILLCQSQHFSRIYLLTQHFGSACFAVGVEAAANPPAVVVAAAAAGLAFAASVVAADGSAFARHRDRLQDLLLGPWEVPASASVLEDPKTYLLDLVVPAHPSHLARGYVKIQRSEEIYLLNNLI